MHTVLYLIYALGVMLMLYCFKPLQRMFVFASFAVVLAGCASAPSSSENYYTDSWWHDDFWFYHDHVYPNCCANDDEFKQLVQNWWHTLDPDKQAQIKDKIDGWKDGNEPDVSALKQQFNQKFDALPPEKQQALTEKREAVRQKMTDTQLTTEQKQALQTKWQSRQRPTLQRAPTKPNISRPVVKPNRPVSRPTTRPATRPIIRPNLGGSHLGGRIGGAGRLGGGRR
ncbi:hypothetical protein [Vibrio rumoiensis]|uniref:DUF3106 domain-containing protein n=1 Tax=Vibrio rumoiensis TaxID=76258 RepID=A0ABW7ITA1_9VIBR